MLSKNECMKASELIPKLSARMVKLGTGELAQLRRMKGAGPGEGSFWHLQREFGFDGTTNWITLVHLMALLTPKGAPTLNKCLHTDRCWGTALGDTGYPERQVLRFLALPFTDRPIALERMTRWLAAKNDGSGVNCVDLFCLLTSDKVQPGRRLAESYYPAKYKFDAQ